MPRSGVEKEGSILRSSLHSQVVERLRTMIIEHELKPGSRVDERGLCEQFGISRTPLREGLKVLAAEGLVELLPNRSPRIATITPDAVGHLFEVVSWLERLAAERAAVRITDRDLQRLRALLQQMQRHLERGERLDYFRENLALHTSIVELSGNPMLVGTYRTLVQHVHRARYLVLQAVGHLDRGVKEHGEILEALAAKDVERAGRLVLAHSRWTGQRIQEALTARGMASAKQ